MHNIRKKDTVVIKKGKDKGKQGEVLKIFSDKGRLLVSKVNFVKRHTRPSQQQPGGVLEKEASIAISNVQLLCPKCNQTTRVKFDKIESGEKVRICRKCGEMVV